MEYIILSVCVCAHAHIISLPCLFPFLAIIPIFFHYLFIIHCYLYLNAISFIQCDHTASLNAFFELFWQSNTTYVTLLGCGCSQATIPVAETSHYWNIPQVKSDFVCILNNLSPSFFLSDCFCSSCKHFE